MFVPVKKVVLRRHKLLLLPSNFSLLNQVTILDLSYNHLGFIPEELSQLEQLEELYLGHN